MWRGRANVPWLGGGCPLRGSWGFLRARDPSSLCVYAQRTVGVPWMDRGARRGRRRGLAWAACGGRGATSCCVGCPAARRRAAACGGAAARARAAGLAARGQNGERWGREWAQRGAIGSETDRWLGGDREGAPGNGWGKTIAGGRQANAAANVRPQAGRGWARRRRGRENGTKASSVHELGTNGTFPTWWGRASQAEARGQQARPKKRLWRGGR
jgi:hypothetical protein